MRCRLDRTIALVAAMLVSMTIGGAAHAQISGLEVYDAHRPGESRAGHGEVSLSYQHSHFNGGDNGTMHTPVGRIDAHAAIAQIDYSLTNRFSVQAGVPYFITRYRGPSPHPTPLDDGSFHGSFQDIFIGGRYLAVDRSVKVEPFFLVTIPTKYSAHAHAAVGQHIYKGEIGSSFAYYPPLDDYYFWTSVSHVFSARPLGHNINHWKASFEAGYYLTPNFVVNAVMYLKQGRGLSMPEDFPVGDHELHATHDKLLKNNYVNVGAGFDWMPIEKTRFSVLALRMVESEDSHIMKYGVLFTIARSF